MVRTQIQLPDRLYDELKALAAKHEWSLAETIRRAAEDFLATYPGIRVCEVDYELPLLRLGEVLVSDEDMREIANTREDYVP